MRLSIPGGPSVTHQFLSDFTRSSIAVPLLNSPDGAPRFCIVDTSQSHLGFEPFDHDTAEQLRSLLDANPGDLIVLQARSDEPFTGSFTALGSLRVALHKFAVAKGHIPAPKGFDFLWVTDFPLFSPASSFTEPGQGGRAGLRSTHHPFTAPKSIEDVDLLLTDPTKAIADHYDLVVNGIELGGGSRRIHDARVQEFILKDVLKVSTYLHSLLYHLPSQPFLPI